MPAARRLISPGLNTKIRLLLSGRTTRLGVLLLAVLLLMAVIGPLVTPYEFDATNLLLGATSPSWQHWLGTDDLGRDLATRLMVGTRLSLMIGLLSTAVSVLIGVTYGATAAYFGGRIDSLLMRVVDILFILPYTILVILLMVFFGRSVYNLFLALGAVQWLVMARIVRGQVLTLKGMDFVAGATLAGVHPVSIVLRHLIPNTLSPVIIYATLSVPAVMLEEAFLSFIGLGVQAPMASLGTMLADGVGAMEIYPWMLGFPCLVLVSCLVALNALGEGLRQAFNPLQVGG